MTPVTTSAAPTETQPTQARWLRSHCRQPPAAGTTRARSGAGPRLRPARARAGRRRAARCTRARWHPRCPRCRRCPRDPRDPPHPRVPRRAADCAGTARPGPWPVGQVGVLPGRARAGLGKVAELGEQRGRRQALRRHPPHAGGDERGELGGQGGQVGLLGGQPGQHVHDRVAAIGRVPGRREDQRGAEGVHVAGRRGRAPSRACSGAMYAGVPTVPCEVEMLMRSAARATPKSITRGPSGATSTLDGFRSRCTRPTRWIESSASAHPAASHRTAATGSGPQARTSRLSDGAGHIRGGQPGQVGLGIGLDDGGGEEPAHLARGRYLLREPVAESRLLGQLDPDRLHRDQPPGRGTAQEDLPHRPGPQAAEDHVRPDPLRVPPAQPRSPGSGSVIGSLPASIMPNRSRLRVVSAAERYR